MSGNAAYLGGGIYTDVGTYTLMNNSLLGNSAYFYGGGIYIHGGTNTLTNNTLSGNAAYLGGGIYTDEGTNALINNNLSGNAAQYEGGGIYTYNGTNALTNNTLSENSAQEKGGGIYTFYGTNTLTNNNLSENVATNYGGGIYSFYSTNMLINNTLSGNSAFIGGGISATHGTNTLTNNTLSGNLASSGGGIATNFGTNTLTNNTLSENVATAGGGILTFYGTNTLTNNTLSGNSAQDNGGGIVISNGTNMLTNNTLSGNSAQDNGGGIYTYYGTNTLTNNIFWANTQGGANNVAGADYYANGTNGNAFAYNLLQLASSNYPLDASTPYGIGTAAAGNIFAQDPLFVDAANIAGADGIHRTADDGLRLQAGSLAIDAGDPAVTTPTTDITGTTRTGVFDMGAYENTATPLCNLGATLNGNTNICAGSVLWLIATGGNQYQWSGPGGYTSTSGSITRTYATPAMSGTYTVIITNNTCVDVLSIEVTVSAIPSATISGTTPVCSGGTISLSAPAGALSYNWSGPGGYTANTETLTRSNATSLMSGMYYVTVTGAGSCTATASKSVSVSPPTNAVISGASSFCSNGSVTLTATTAGVSYDWSGPGGFTYSGASMTRTPAVAGTYTVTVTNALGCIATKSKTVTVTTTPTATISAPLGLNACVNGYIYLTASGGNSYAWSGPGGFSSTSTLVYRRPATAAMSGTYTVTVTSGGCTATASVVVTVSACKVAEETETLTAYPNPFTQSSTIAFTLPETTNAVLTVFSIDGKEVAQLFKGTAEAGQLYTVEFDGADLAAGVYIVSLSGETGEPQRYRLVLTK